MATQWSSNFLCCASFLFLAACKPSAPPSVAPATTESAATQPAQTPTPEQLEAESSLSVKRGIVTQKDKVFSIRLCAANNEVPLTDQPDGTLARVYGELGNKPIYIEAYGERATAPDNFALEELLYASAVNPTNACTAPAATYELMARGSEPAWSVEVKKDSMLLRQNDAPTEIKFTGVDTSESEGSVTYRAGVDKHILELTVTQRTCHDKITAEFFAYNAAAKLDKRSLNGCARVGE